MYPCLHLWCLGRPFRRPSKCSFCHQRRERMWEEEERLPPPPPSQIVGRRCEHIKNDAAAGGTHKYAHHTTLQRMCPLCLCPQYGMHHGKEEVVFLWNLYILLSLFYETFSIVHLAGNTWNIIYHIDRVDDIQPTWIHVHITSNKIRKRITAVWLQGTLHDMI